MFEDTDLCYRITRAGYRLRLVANAFVHHWGSQTLQRVVPDVAQLLRQNGEIFRAKWSYDLECGYASHLPGFSLNEGLVRFNQSRRPEKVHHHLEDLKNRAKISLCMIVRNEERVLDQCLTSAKPFFKEIIVVDTGSTDMTKDIVLRHGAKLIESSWPDSFAIARNESLSHATGDWIFWLDADDVLPLASGEAVLNAAINVGSDITALVVPVQFVEEGPNAGTRVDHVKLIRNFEGIQFEGRIHEQILESVRTHGGEVARLNAVVVHAGYDTSVEGQAGKRERDWHLLNLDLEDRPNHPFVWFNIGMTHHFSSEHVEAIKALQTSIQLSGPKDSHLRKAYSLMGVSYRELGHLDESESAFKEGLVKVGQDPELIFHLAMTSSAKGDLFEAKRLYESVPEDTGDYFTSIDIGIHTFKRLFNLGGVKLALGDYLGAKNDWLKAYELNPGATHSLVAIIDAALAFGDFVTARSGIEELRVRHGDSLDWAERRAKLADLTEEPGGGLGIMEHVAATRWQDIGPGLVVARRYIEANQIERAFPYLVHLERSGVAEAAFMLGVHALKHNDLSTAINYTKRAVELNPSHEQSIRQLGNLIDAINEPTPSALTDAEQQELLIGSDARTLGRATKRHSVVIVTFNSEEWIVKCLDSVLPTLGKDDEIIIVDNASSDKTVNVIPKSKQVSVIANRENIGYASAANVGIRASKGKYITLLNPDTEVRPGWLDGLCSKLTDETGAVGPVSDNIGGAQFIGHYLEAGLELEQIQGELTNRLGGQTKDTKLLMGMCVMSPRKVLDKTGLLDENLVLGADDLELSWRLRQLGYSLTIALDVFVHHAGQRSFVTQDRNVVSDLVAASDAQLRRKLVKFYGDNLPTSHELWACDIFSQALTRKMV
jgi:GT2 family glycosyltransferase/tetratricopeptide (TPR) repeat protein